MKRFFIFLFLVCSVVCRADEAGDARELAAARWLTGRSDAFFYGDSVRGRLGVEGTALTMRDVRAVTNTPAFLAWYTNTPAYLDLTSGETNAPTLNISLYESKQIKQRLAANMNQWRSISTNGFATVQQRTTIENIREAGTNTVNIMRRMLGE